MLYLSLKENTVKCLVLKKTLLGQEETDFFQKNYETKILDQGKPVNVDLLASVVKEVISHLEKADKKVTLILPQNSFSFFRTVVPSDIALSALNSFILDKAKSKMPLFLDDYLTAYFIKQDKDNKVVNFFALSKENFDLFSQALSLIDLEIVSLIPESLTYFKLFEKTLRQEKKENILYGVLNKNSFFGYLFDNLGLLEEKPYQFEFKDEEEKLKLLKNIAEEKEKNQQKLNRLILSGEESENIRQDTFTKEVRVWTNLLKKIVPNFYQSYLKTLVVNPHKPFPLLSFDSCFGAFILSQEEKFSFNKEVVKSLTKKKNNLHLKFSLSKKEVFLFLGSFVLSFLFFYFFSQRGNLIPNLTSKKKLTLTSTPTPFQPTTTPTPSFKKTDLKIQVLNGSGIPGKASQLKEILKKKGYEEIIIGNADNYDYKITEIKVKKSKLEARKMIQDDLKEYLTNFKDDLLDEKETPDVIIIFGSDFK